MAQAPKPNELLICDTNVVIKMFLFSKAILFPATYTFGKVRIHPSVLEEIENWIRRSNSKCQKFGKPLLEDIVATAAKYSSGLKEPTPPQRLKGMSAVSAIESRLDDTNLGAATSIVDKELLVSAYVNGANLATQEKTLTAVAKKSLGESRVFCFEDLVIDLLTSKKMKPVEAESGLESLEKMNEHLSSAGTQRVRAAVSSAKAP